MWSEPYVLDLPETRSFCLDWPLVDRPHPDQLTPLPSGLPKSIAKLDLSKIKMKLMHDEDRPMTEEEVDNGIKWYRRFLALCLWYPKGSGVSLCPTKLIDRVWHQHILDTATYRLKDCPAIFGEYLDHDQYFGMDDASVLVNAGNQMHDLYLKHFGESPHSLGTYCSSCRPHNCKTCQRPG